ncbi:MAG: sensor histidine kinase KdpD [Gemmataceae bacterium]|nr:sensor histidine kinase KdpD [Gemmataceae bacterium]
MADSRPDPDELLARVQAEESHARRGKLRIYFGYAAGVGKTYAMLVAARREKADGTDVVVGYVEPHGRKETEALLEGLECLPLKQVAYRGVNVNEFDLDAALQRRPQLLLVDELAHTNAEGMRHLKRWQDVEELLHAGIDVSTTLNVQHLESLNDVIAQITNVAVRETLPDALLEKADEIELIDLTPEELIERLREGKVYLPQQAEQALQNFFKKGHLSALRELSLRQAAQRLRRDVDTARTEQAAQKPWASGERLLVCAGPSPTSAKLIRTSKRMASAFGADWLAVAVHPPLASASDEKARLQVAHHLRMAEQLGAETHILSGANVADTVLEFARTRNVTKIVVGKSDVPIWSRLWKSTVVEQILDRSGDIDVYVTRGGAEEKTPRPLAPAVAERTIEWKPYGAAAGVVALCAAIGWLIHAQHASEANVVMVFLLGVVFVASRYGRGAAAAASVASVLVFDFFFVPPQFKFAVSDTQYLLTFFVMLMVGLLISTLTARLQAQLFAARDQERRTSALYRLTRQLSEVAGVDFLIANAGQQLRDIFQGDVLLYLKPEQGPVELRFGSETPLAKDSINPLVAQWVADHGEIAGIGTSTLPNATAFFVPLLGSQRSVGALGVRPSRSQRLWDVEERRLLETCASLIALSLERDQSVLESHQAQLQVHEEQLRNSLLSSVSHDLRTPLAAIAGSASSLLDHHVSEACRRELTESIVEEAHRLARLVDNLLEMTRLQSGQVAVRKQWHVFEEIVGSARSRLRSELGDRAIRVAIPEQFPLLHVDGLLLEQVFVNLFENAVRYTPKGTPIEVRAERIGKTAVIKFADRGPGLPPGAEGRVFEKFFRGGAADGPPDRRRGVGLGLAICQAIVAAHDGKIEARNRPGGGAEFVLTLRADEPAPTIPSETLLAGVPS